MYEGLLRSTPDKFPDAGAVLRLWRHELLRCLADRLVCPEDKATFSNKLAEVVAARWVGACIQACRRYALPQECWALHMPAQVQRPQHVQQSPPLWVAWSLHHTHSLRPAGTPSWRRPCWQTPACLVTTQLRSQSQAQRWVHTCWVHQFGSRTFLHIVSTMCALETHFLQHVACTPPRPPWLVCTQVRLYEDLGSFEAVKPLWEQLLRRYNARPGCKQMELVFFEDALDHLTRIERTLRLPQVRPQVVLGVVFAQHCLGGAAPAAALNSEHPVGCLRRLTQNALPRLHSCRATACWWAWAAAVSSRWRGWQRLLQAVRCLRSA